MLSVYKGDVNVPLFLTLFPWQKNYVCEVLLVIKPVTPGFPADAYILRQHEEVRTVATSPVVLR